MPDKFRSGEITNKYDQVVEPAIVSGYEELKRKVDIISDEQKCLSESYINFTTQYVDFYQTSLQHVPTMISKVINMEAQLTAFRPNIIALAVLLNKILSSKLIRFFNFFGHWYKVKKFTNQDNKTEIGIIIEYGGEEFCLSDIINNLTHLFNNF